MAVVEFSADAEREFREAGLSAAYVDALRLCVHHLRIMRSKPPNAAAVRSALKATDAAARRLRASLTRLTRPPDERSANALAGFVLDEALTFVDDPWGEEGATIVGNSIAEELAKVQRLCDATDAALGRMPVFAPPSKKGGQPVWNATPAIYRALERVWIGGGGGARPDFLALSHSTDSPFRRIVDACYREGGRVEGVPEKAFEGFVTQQLGQKKELRRGLEAALDAEAERIRNE